MNLEEFISKNNYPEILFYYDLMYAHRVIDTNYFMSLIKNRKIKEPIMELGCGTGRVLIPLAFKFPHLKFVGVDILKEYIEYCKIKIIGIQNFLTACNKNGVRLNNIELYVGDMCQLCKILPSEKLKFGLIILCNSTFLHIWRKKDRESLFSNIRKFLSPNGLFILDYTPLPVKSNNWEERDIVGGYKIFRKNKVVEGGVTHRFYKFVPISSRKAAAIFSATLYPVSNDEVEKMCDSNGLEIKRKITSYPGEPSATREIYFIGLKN
jgi:SAM-dependent methyltransferase